MNIPVMATLPNLRSVECWAVKPTTISEGLLIASTVFRGGTIEMLARVINISNNDRKLKKGQI